jgi:hypothetical protein
MEDVIDSIATAELLGVTRNNLRQLVYRKILVPVGKEKRRSLFNRVDVEAIKKERSPSVPSV